MSSTSFQRVLSSIEYQRSKRKMSSFHSQVNWDALPYVYFLVRTKDLKLFDDKAENVKFACYESNNFLLYLERNCECNEFISQFLSWILNPGDLSIFVIVSYSQLFVFYVLFNIFRLKMTGFGLHSGYTNSTLRLWQVGTIFSVLFDVKDILKYLSPVLSL